MSAGTLKLPDYPLRKYSRKYDGDTYIILIQYGGHIYPLQENIVLASVKALTKMHKIDDKEC